MGSAQSIATFIRASKDVNPDDYDDLEGAINAIAQGGTDPRHVKLAELVNVILDGRDDMINDIRRVVVEQCVLDIAESNSIGLGASPARAAATTTTFDSLFNS